ncbi:hypothetical protein [Modestobacter sp. NPDC049651]|uniref:hypothetical protein n=1 Tax=unclassified Modestobacter TaxID=2643866 RepID=UPI0033C7FF1D
MATDIPRAGPATLRRMDLPARTRVLLLGAATAVLTVLAAVVGGLGWPAPRRSLSGWQVADVPAGLAVAVVATALVCLATAAALTRPERLGRAVAVVWCVLALVAVGAHVWNDLYFAALGADPDFGPIIPVFDGFFTFLPALVVALVAIPRGRAEQLRAGLGTAVVGVPVLALGWSLYHAADGFWPAALGSLWPALVFGAAPVAVALALTVPLNSRAAPGPRPVG